MKSLSSVKLEHMVGSIKTKSKHINERNEIFDFPIFRSQENQNIAQNPKEWRNADSPYCNRYFQLELFESIYASIVNK